MTRRSTIVLGSALGISAGVLALTLSLSTQSAAQAVIDTQPTPILTYPTYPPTPTLEPAPAPGASVAAALFTSSFDNVKDLASFTPADLDFVTSETKGQWAVSDGSLFQDGTVSNGNPSMHPVALFANDLSLSDLSVQASFYNSSNGTAGLITHRNGDTYYRYDIIADYYSDTPKQMLVKVQDGLETVLASVDAPGFESYRWYTMEMTVQGGQIRVTLDGQEVLQAVDKTPLAAGSVGLYSRAFGGMRFDNLIIAQP